MPSSFDPSDLRQLLERMLTAQDRHTEEVRGLDKRLSRIEGALENVDHEAVVKHGVQIDRLARDVEELKKAQAQLRIDLAGLKGKLFGWSFIGAAAISGGIGLLFKFIG